MSLTQADRDSLFTHLNRLPEPYGYTLKANKDGSYSITLGGKKGHTKGRPTMRSRGSWSQVVRDAGDFIRMLEARGDMA